MLCGDSFLFLTFKNIKRDRENKLMTHRKSSNIQVIRFEQNCSPNGNG